MERMEWIFENFSSWDKEIHGNFLLFGCSQMKLFPRGLSGDEERLVVRVADLNPSSRIELSYIGADGSLLCKQEVQDPEWLHHDPGFEFTLPPGPKFEDVVKSKDLHKDVLVLRLFFSRNKQSSYGYTKIDVDERCLKIPSNLFDDTALMQWIAVIFLSHGDQTYYMNLIVDKSREGDDKTYFSFMRLFSKKVLIRTDASLLDRNGIVIKSEKNKRITSDSIFFSISNSKVEKGCHVILSIKYTPGTTQQMQLHRSVERIECASTDQNMPPKNTNSFTAENISDGSTKNPVMVLSEDLAYKDQDISDFQIKCGDVTFPVHRAILSARSLVFKTMLSADTRESVLGSVDIEDLDPSTLARFLAFFYAGKVKDLECDSALKLYYAADKYEVTTLKKKCADFLSARTCFK